MSKKKAFSGSTMTLKDFHGGSIPSDLSLPSAPGAVARPSDRTGFDRQIQTAWGNPMGRSDHRSRPGSSGTNRNFDDKASFLSHPAHIGRNFDEDERKPLDGISMPRRTISDEAIRVQPSRPEPKPDSVTPTKFPGRQVSSPVSQSPGVATNSYAARYTESIPVGANNQIPGGNNTNQVVPNAWGMRKEMGVSEPVSSAWSGPNAVSRFAQASALEKVSSGRWQTKQHSFHPQPDVEVIHLPEAESDYHFKDHKAYSGVNPMNERGDSDEIRVRYGEKGWIADDGTVNGKELPNLERARSPMYPEAKESNSPLYPDVVRPVSTDGKYGGSKLQPPVPSEVSERPKLKLLPRTKPLEVSEPSVTDYKPGYHQLNDLGHVATVNELYGNANAPKPGSAGNEGGSQAVERPKLNLKPRTVLDQSEGSAARERKSVFGGARPRELVLKERGIDDVVISNLDPIQSPNRVKPDIQKTEIKPEQVVQTARYGERLENLPADQRTSRDPERKDIRGDNNKTETQKSSWRKESWRNGRVTEKQQEPRPEPETWRKPVEQPKPAPSDAPGLRYGKAASALELAQAFSKSISEPKTADRISGQKGMPGQSQIPFSRLTATQELYSGRTPRRQINGY
ncbi:hypothetical protein BVC80_8997g21 [Macleaya cordata]|uniref:Uncharacterized protein n=1 Tax=Macleaya cordata TaxID=56857 RepID=A0A200QME3_MACCD|nr:hypothetical protein BVC80_8997g21 [Macleaya cordata]